MAYEIIPEYNLCVFHPLDTANNQGSTVTAHLDEVDLRVNFGSIHFTFFSESELSRSLGELCEKPPPVYLSDQIMIFHQLIFP